MQEPELQTIDELKRLLDEMETQAPVRKLVAGTPVAYRPVTDEETIDDSLPLAHISHGQLLDS